MFLPIYQIPSAYLAVDFFFLLSGFVLAHAYERRFAAGLSLGQFIRLRLIRLYPLFFLGIALGAIVEIARARLGVDHLRRGGFTSALISGLAMLPPFVKRPLSTLFPLNMPAWSLFYEGFANLALALIWRWLSNRNLGLIIAISGAALCVIAVFHGDVNVGPAWPTFWLGFPRVLFSFFAGVGLRRWAKGLPSSTARWWVPPTLVIAVSTILLTQVDGALRIVFNLLTLFLAFPAIIWFGAKFEPSSTAEKGIYQSLGVCSYAIYLLHYPCLQLLLLVLAKEQVNAERFPFWLYGVLLCAFWGLCELVDRFYDLPIRRFLTRIASRPEPAR